LTTETVSFRLRKELKDLAKRYKLDISKIAREKVEEELERLQREEREKTLAKAAKVLSNVTKDDIVTAVRKSRESRYNG
jgi:post-segregation antitoxin (ccd killing protein)